MQAAGVSMKSQGNSKVQKANQPGVDLGNRGFGVTVKLSLEYGGHECMSQEKADLLAAIHQTQNLSAASKQLGISYRHAWQLLKDLNGSTGKPFVETLTGGAAGGLTKLTQLGEKILHFYQSSQREIRKHAAEVVHKRVANLQTERSEIRLFAAISLQNFISQVVAEFSLSNPAVKISTAYAASDQLETMIREGTNFDMFISGDRDQLVELQRGKVIAQKEVQPIAMNSLIVVSSVSSRSPGVDVRSTLAKCDGHIVVSSESSPLGRITAKWLKKCRLKKLINDKLLFVDNAAAVIPAIRSAPGSVGIAFASEAIERLDMTVLHRIPADNCSLTYWLGLSIGSENSKTVTQLCNFLSSKESSSIATRCGLGVVRN
jgi:molybdate transport system regulatory protein